MMTQSLVLIDLYRLIIWSITSRAKLWRLWWILFLVMIASIISMKLRVLRVLLLTACGTSALQLKSSRDISSKTIKSTVDYADISSPKSKSPS